MSDLVSSQLVNEFSKIGKNHWQALRRTHARNVLGPSVIRVFKKGTKKELVSHLQEIEIDQLKSIKNQTEFNKWFDDELESLAKVVRRHNHNNKRINPGVKWGHSSKVLCLYCNAMVLFSRYFSDDEATRLSFWLFVPLDGIILRKLESLDYTAPAKIRLIQTRKDFYRVQNDLGSAASTHQVPRVWFDDYWSDRLASKKKRLK